MYDNGVEKIAYILKSRIVNIILGLLLFFMWVMFAIYHYSAFLETKKYVLLIFFLSETLQAFFFLFRSRPETLSVHLFDWLVALGGTFTVLFFRPSSNVLWSGGEVLIIIGIVFQILALLSLNRSFAIVAAKRKIKTRGLYHFVRHPMYMSYFFLYTGYVLFNASIVNGALCALAFIFLYLRIESEEEHLSLDPEYQAYKRVVRYRLFPFVY